MQKIAFNFLLDFCLVSNVLSSSPIDITALHCTTSLAAKLIKILGARRRFRCLAGERQSLRAFTERGRLGRFLELVRTGFSSE